MNNLFEELRELNTLSLFVRLLLAVALGGLIGVNREKRKMPAGIRTYMLVCMGACLTAMLALYDAQNIALLLGGSPKTDVGRFSAQVINGIGFLGAGTIMLSGGRIRGITTAACLWASGCMGIAIGFGFFECAVAGFVAILLVIYVLPKIQRKLRSITETKTTVEEDGGEQNV